MEEEYLSDLSSSYEEEKPSKRKKKNHTSDSMINNNNNDNENDNDNDSHSNVTNDNYHMNNINGVNSVFLDPRVREQQELSEAIRLSLLESGKRNVIIPKHEDNSNNQNRNTENHLQMNNQFNNRQHNHKRHHRSHKSNSNEASINGNSEVSIEQIMLQSKKEEENTKSIREFISNRENLHETLGELPGVDPNDPCFEQFFE